MACCRCSVSGIKVTVTFALSEEFGSSDEVVDTAVD